MRERSWLQQVRYYVSVYLVYALTVLFGWYAIHPVAALGRQPQPAIVQLAPATVRPIAAAPVVSGTPVRIIIPASGVDLPVDPGVYDSATNSWTLSGLRAQFAMISSPANSQSGDTFIYGHNNNNVFGALRHNTPAVGAQALVYTDNGHVFAYSFDSALSLAPDDTSVLEYHGPPILTVQTCTGTVNEWRTMYKFHFERVIQ